MSDATALNPARTTRTAADRARDEFLDFYEGHTLAGYTDDLRLFYAWCADNELDPMAVTRLDLEEYVRHMLDKRGNAPSTIRRRIATLRRFYRLAAHDGYLEKSPGEFVRLPRAVLQRQQADLGPNRAEIAAMLTVARTGRPMDAALIALLTLMGLRVSEACGLSVEDVLHVESGHRVIRFVGKGSKHAALPMPVLVWRLVNDAIAGRATGPLLLRRDGSPLNRVAAARVVRRIATDAGIERHMTPHQLRNGFVSTMLDAGVSLRDTQTAARHSDPRMTARYDKARYNLDRAGNYVLAAYIAGAA